MEPWILHSENIHVCRYVKRSKLDSFFFRSVEMKKKITCD